MEASFTMYLRFFAVASLALTAALLSPSTLAAQPGDPQARDQIRQALELARTGDTLAALNELREAVQAAPKSGEAWYELGRLHAEHASAVDGEFRERLEAEKALLRCLKIEPDNPHYLLALGKLRIKQHMNTDGRRILERALDRASKQGVEDPEMLAEIHYRLGWLHGLFLQRQEGRRMVGPLRAGIAPGVIGGPGTGVYSNRPLPSDRAPASSQTPSLDAYSGYTGYVHRFLQDAPPAENSGADELDKMMHHYRAAVGYEPGHIAASTHLMSRLLDQGRIREYLSVARSLAEAHPDVAQAQLFLGLGLHSAGREEEAGAAFERGLAALPEAQRRSFLSLADVLRRKVAERYGALGSDRRDEFEAKYWRLSDPLYLTEANEARLEHLARVTYAGLRFFEPGTKTPGWETDRGQVWVRYGPPLQIARVGDTVIWDYGKGIPVFMFQDVPGYVRMRFAGFAGDYKFVAEDFRFVMPVSYAHIPSIPELYRIPVQIARFRGGTPDEVAVEVDARLPLRRLAGKTDLATTEIRTGLFLLNGEGEMIVRRVGESALPREGVRGSAAFRSWRLLLPPSGPLVAAVEARNTASWGSAVSRDTFTAIRFPADSLSVSDILMADQMRRLTKEPVRRADLDIVPNAGLRYEVGQPVHIYWETYGLQGDDEGVASYDVAVSVRVTKLYREGVIANFLGPLADAWGFSIVGDDRVELRYHREAKMGDRDRVIEYLGLDLKEAPAGEYEVRVRVWDRLHQRMAERKRSFSVVAPG